ncbi:MAG: aldehyde dehydrogenase family protein, partial [Gemmatimonadales bacterium]
MTDLLASLGLSDLNPGTATGVDFFQEGDAQVIESHTPVDGSRIAGVTATTRAEYDRVVEAAESAFGHWRMVPAPERGEIVRQIGNELREHKDALGRLVSWEMGKIHQEGLGEVQEMIDICDFAVG